MPRRETGSLGWLVDLGAPGSGRTVIDVISSIGKSLTFAVAIENAGPERRGGNQAVVLMEGYSSGGELGSTVYGPHPWALSKGSAAYLAA